jgi:hypothetical protein
LVKSVHLEQNVLAWNKTFLPETKCSCLPHTAYMIVSGVQDPAWPP